VKHWIGRWLMCTALIHTVVATFQYSSVIASVADRGVFNTVAGDPVTGAVVWSLLFGAVAMIGGLAVTSLEKCQAWLPQSLGWCLLALAVTGAVLVPISGFWLLFVPSAAILLKKANSAAATSR
jgi:hypothetical protein